MKTSALVRRAAVLAFTLAAFVAQAAAQALAPAKPETVGLSSERLARITAVTKRYVDEGKIAGVVTLVARGGKLAHLEAVGQADREAGVPMRTDTIFRIAS